MATPDSSVPAESEKGFGGGHNQGTSRRATHLIFAGLVFRILAFCCTLSAFVVMITDKQTKRFFISPLSPLFITKSAKYHYSDAFKWFVVANGVAFSYLLLTILLTAFMRSVKIARVVLLLDLLVSYMIMSAAAAATAVAYIGKNGLSESGWQSICGTFNRYCAHVVGALVVCYLGWLYLTFVIIISLHRTWKN